MFERLERLIGMDALDKISNVNILLVGVGGVGGTCLEALVRSGIKNITIIDGDVFQASNLNRQILATQSDLGKPKVEVAKKRMLKINDEINIEAQNMYVNEENINSLGKYDFIIDACDDVSAKLALMKYAEDNKIEIISSMGTGKRLNPSSVIITRLDKTSNDALAKKIRYEARKRGLSLKIPVCCSKEEALNKDKIVSSSIFVPSTAGLLIAYYVIEKVIKIWLLFFYQEFG